MTSHGGVLYYVVKVPKEGEEEHGSVESGWENPFRPGGDLSREADEIVELIKGGKPITPTPGQAPSIPNDQLDGHHQQNSLHPNQEPVTQSPKKATQLNSTPKSANGTTKADAKPGAVDVQRTTLKPQGNVQVRSLKPPDQAT
nr:unnamed protein product [Callosobruchus chinensis]